MGKLTLLLVGAAILGGSLFTFSTRQITAESEAGTREQQADLLSRQIAESGHAIVLSSIVGADGFVAATDATHRYEGGSFRVEYDPASTSDRATFRVHADYAGATHTIESTYEWDPMGYPGPIWLDSPYVTASVASGATVTGGADALMAQFDRRRHDLLGLEPFVPLATMEAGLASTLGRTTAGYHAGRTAGSWPGFLEDLNVGDGEGLYQAALLHAPETILAGPLAVTGSQSGVGGADEVTHVTGDLTIAPGGALRGSGALIIDGLLSVESGGALDWTGIVLARSDAQFAPARLLGDVSITGGLVVVQNAYPPGGHMDVTVWRDLARGLSASNVRGEASLPPWAGKGTPFLQHLHRFDIDLGTRRVAFLEDGDAVPSQEAWTQFEDTLDRLGDEEVYLEFENEGEHGYGQYHLDVDGEPAPYVGTVLGGFGDFALDSDAHRTRVFRADDLEDFAVDIKALQGLRARFDGEGGCDTATQWPRCIGARWDRGGVLRVQLRKASDSALLYEAGLYWHMLAAEWSDYEARMNAWRARIQAGELFGARLEMGPDAAVDFQMAPILRLAERLGFDGHEVVHVGSTAIHHSPTENVELARRGDGTVEVCHAPGAGQSTLAVARGELGDHLRHGDRILACDGTPASGGPPGSIARPSQTPPTCGTSPPMVSICNKPGSSWSDRVVACDQVANHIGHGCRLGTCAENGLTGPDASAPQLPTATCPAGQTYGWDGTTWTCG